MFLVPDPLEYPDGLNTYIYCNQNPWTRFDPTGLDIADINKYAHLRNRLLGGAENNKLNSTLVYGNLLSNMLSVSVSLHPAVAMQTVITGKDSSGNIVNGSERILEVASVVPIGKTIKVATKAIKSNKELEDGVSVYRYVSKFEAKIAKKTGKIPNTLSDNITQKNVFVTPNKYDSAKEAEKALQIGKKDPRGILPTPTHRITGDATGIPFEQAGVIDGGSSIELITKEKIPVKKIERLKD